MILEDVRLWRFTTPLVAPVEVRPGLVLGDRETLLVEMIADGGRTSWGEAAPLPGFSPESLDEAVATAKVFARGIATRRASLADLAEVLPPAVTSLPSLEFAIETAIAALEEESPGAPYRIRTTRLLQGNHGDIIRQVNALVSAGFSCLKLKVGRQAVEDDVSLLVGIRRIAGEGVSLRADANRSWTMDEATRFAEGVADLNLDFVEEPLQDPSRLEDLYGETGLALAIDETLAEWGTTEVDLPGCLAALVLKPTLLGGRRTRALISVAHRTGIKAVLSSCYESGVGTAAVARLARRTSPNPAAVGLGTIAWIGRDCLGPSVDLARPELAASEITGSRIRPLKNRLQPIPIE